MILLVSFLKNYSTACFDPWLKKGTFSIGGWWGGGGREMTGASERRVISKSFTNWGGQTCFVRRQGRVTLFSARKKIFHVASVKSTL